MSFCFSDDSAKKKILKKKKNRIAFPFSISISTWRLNLTEAKSGVNLVKPFLNSNSRSWELKKLVRFTLANISNLFLVKVRTGANPHTLVASCSLSWVGSSCLARNYKTSLLMFSRLQHSSLVRPSAKYVFSNVLQDCAWLSSDIQSHEKSHKSLFYNPRKYEA